MVNRSTTSLEPSSLSRRVPEAGEGAGSGRAAPARSRSDRVFAAAMVLLIAALWIATRPYYGVVHDARLYMVEALHAIEPARFADDLYFRFGSQDQFTIFSKLYAPLVAAFGVSRAAIVLTIAGQALFVAGLLYLAHSVIRPRGQAWLASAGAIALPGAYLIFLRYGEPFVTPRLFAEGLSLLALGCLLRGRTLWALLVLVVSAAVHPLETLPALALAFLYLAIAQPLWWAVIVGGLAMAAGLGFLGFQPFANLRAFYDPQWYAIVKLRNSQNLMTGWIAVDYIRTIGAFALAGIALPLAEPRERRFLGAALAIAIGGILCTAIGGDVLHDIFIVEVQPWRAVWLLSVLANLFAAPTLVRLLARRDRLGLAVEAFGLALALSFIAHFVPPLVIIAAPMMTVAVLMALWQLGPWRLGKGAGMVCLPVMAIAVVAALLLAYQFAISGFAQLWPEELRPGLYSLGIALAALLVLRGAVDADANPSGGRLAWIAGGLALAALYGWDARSPWTKLVESPDPVPAALASLLPAGGSVYWEGGLEMMWFRLRRPDYFSCDQGTGALFFRPTAIAYQHRLESFSALQTLDFRDTVQCQGVDKHAGEQTRADLAAVCAREPDLDYLVLARPVADVEAKTWDSPATFRDVRAVDGKMNAFETNRFYRYDCAALR
jgi:hypothetical protein